MKVIVGLGNPGNQYANSRHNIGFVIVDRLSYHLGIPLKGIKYKSIIGQGNYREEKVILLKPQTFMNLTGQSVYDIYKGLNIDTEDIMVVYDDMDLPFGSIRFRPKGGSGGHKGMSSIIYNLQSEDFPRLRFGIGKPLEEIVTDYVLSPFDSEEHQKLPELIENASKGIIDWLLRGINFAMNNWNIKV